MNWRKLALKNSWGNARTYFGYLLSSSLSIMVFFMFALFVDNPSVDQGITNENARMMLQVCRWITVLFAIFFILFFHAALIRSRKKEIGLFLVLGMQRGQVASLVFYESILLGGVAIVIGIGLGTLFGKLFLLAMSNILDLAISIPFAIPTVSIKTSIILFGILFLVDGFLVAFRVSRYTPKSLLIGGRVRQSPPRSSLLLALVGVLLLGAAYYLAIFMSYAFIITVIPIITLTIIGSYLVYRQLLFFILQRMRKRPLKGIPLLIVSRISYRIRDQTRMLTLITVLVAVVLTGMGSVYSSIKISDILCLRNNPFSYQMIVNEGKPAPTPEWVHAKFNENHLNIERESKTRLIKANLSGDEKIFETWVISDTDFKRLVETIRITHPEVERYLNPEDSPQEGGAKFYVPAPVNMGKLFPSKMVEVQIGDFRKSLKIQGQNDTTRVINMNGISPFTTLVVTDQEFTTLMELIPNEAKWISYEYMTSDWSKSFSTIESMKDELIPYGINERKIYQSDTIVPVQDIKQFFGVALFAGFFISILFILACGSTIYFKLFTQQEEDQRQFNALRKMGFHKKEVGKVLNVELFLLFFVPFLFALLHSYVAMIDYSHLIVNGLIPGANFWPAFILVVLISLVCFLVYYLFARVRYVRQIWHQS